MPVSAKPSKPQQRSAAQAAKAKAEHEKRMAAFRARVKEQDKLVRAAIIAGVPLRVLSKIVDVPKATLKEMWRDELRDAPMVQKAHAFHDLICQSADGNTKATELLLKKLDPATYRDKGPLDPEGGLPIMNILLDLRPPEPEAPRFGTGRVLEHQPTDVGALTFEAPEDASP